MHSKQVIMHKEKPTYLTLCNHKRRTNEMRHKHIYKHRLKQTQTFHSQTGGLSWTPLAPSAAVCWGWQECSERGEKGEVSNGWQTEKKWHWEEMLWTEGMKNAFFNLNQKPAKKIVCQLSCFWLQLATEQRKTIIHSREKYVWKRQAYTYNAVTFMKI